MIELPEAITLARQITAELKGTGVIAGTRGNSPHKFAFYNREPEEYEAILPGKMVGQATAHGSQLLVPLAPDHLLVLGGGGERILLHADESTLPKKHQLLLAFADGRFLTVSVQGWGSVLLLHQSEAESHHLAGPPRVSPVDQAFTFEYFSELFGRLESDAHSVKYFAISKPGIWGVGNGYLQDILFRAKLHPRRRARDLKQSERRAFYAATREVLRTAVEQGGRDSERDLYNRPGHYRRLLNSKAVGAPCPVCGTPIEKISFLGGASYFCPTCQGHSREE